MDTQELNIVDLVTNNPITRLTSAHRHQLLVKIQQFFTDAEQRFFLASFYCYLNHDPLLDFVINLEHVLVLLGYNNHEKGKALLKTHFKLNTDYKVLLLHENIKKRGRGHTKETYMINVHTFKRFCVRASTPKAYEIHEYYIKLEELIQEVLSEESDELKRQLQHKDDVICYQDTQLQIKEIEKEYLREATILEQFGKNTQCVYIGLIDNKSDAGEPLVKFGNSNNLVERVATHKKTYQNFRLANAYKVVNNVQIENAIKSHPNLSVLRRTVVINGANRKELLVADPNCAQINDTIKAIIKHVEYSPENYSALFETNLNLTAEVGNLRSEIRSLEDKLAASQMPPMILDAVICEDSILLTEYPTGNVVVPSTGRKTKGKDGFFQINGVKYATLTGSKIDVWNNVAYQTSGRLVKNDLMVSKSAKIVSKKKSNLANLLNICKRAAANII